MPYFCFGYGLYIRCSGPPQVLNRKSLLSPCGTTTSCHATEVTGLGVIYALNYTLPLTGTVIERRQPNPGKTAAMPDTAIFRRREIPLRGVCQPARRSECSAPSWGSQLEGIDTTIPKTVPWTFLITRGSSVCTQGAASATKGYTGHRQKSRALQDGGASTKGASQPI